MFSRSEWTIPADNVKSLCWRGDELLDILSGYVYRLDGSVLERWISLGRERFNTALVSPSGNYAVIYEILGTKGAVIDITDSPGQKVLREINRSFDNAEAFEYPVLLFQLPDGREAIAHCPDAPDQLVIEELISGARIAASSGESFSSMDYYYSRLAINPNATRILSTGWAWQPCTWTVLYDIQSILVDPEKLNKDDALFNTPTETNSAAFFGDDLLVITGAYDPEYTENDPWLPPGGIALYNLANQKCISSARFNRPLGTLMPINKRLVVEFYEHPKLINIETAEIIHCWEDIDSGNQESSIIWHIPPLPPIAIDAAHNRFAVAMDSSIRVVEITVL